MAHRVDVIQVHKNYPPALEGETVTDPVCGKKMTRKESRSVLARNGQAIYFCSKDCRDKFASGRFTAKAA